MIGLLVVVVGIGAAIAIVATFSVNAAHGQAEERVVLAQTLCRDFIWTSLGPSTVDATDFGGQSVAGSETGPYTVTGEVQDRSYTCVLTADGQAWRLESLSIQPPEG